MDTFDFLVPFIALGMIKHEHEQEYNIFPNSKQEYYGTGVHLVPIKVLPWEEYISRITDI